MRFNSGEASLGKGCTPRRKRRLRWATLRKVISVAVVDRVACEGGGQAAHAPLAELCGLFTVAKREGERFRQGKLLAEIARSGMLAAFHSKQP